MKEKNPIDELFKRRLGSEVTPFNEAHWEAMDGLLSQQPKRKKGFWWWISGLALLLLASAAIGYAYVDRGKMDHASTLSQEKDKKASSEEVLQLTSLESEPESAIGSEEQNIGGLTGSEDSLAADQENVASSAEPNPTPQFGEEGEDPALANPGSETPSNRTPKDEDSNPFQGADPSLAGGGSVGADNPNVQSAPDENEPSNADDDKESMDPFESIKGSRGTENGGAYLAKTELLSFSLFENNVKTDISGEKVSFPAFKPMSWKVTGIATFGKYTAVEKQSASQDVSLVSEFEAPTPLLSPTVGVDVAYSFGSWSLSSGIRQTRFNEEVDFGVGAEELTGYEYFEYQVIDSISEILVEQIDSVYIEEEEFWQVDTTFIEVQDTTFSWVPDSLAVYEGGGPLLNERPYSQQVSFVEVPFMVGKTFQFKRFETTVRTGPSIGFLTTVNGYYFKDEGVIQERREVTKSVLMNWQTELSLRYLLNAKWSAGVLVGDRRAITPFFQNGGATLKYKGQYVGLSVGYAF